MSPETAPTVHRGDLIQLEISSSAFEGKAVARVEGYVVFVEGAVPGDTVMAKITKAKKNYAEARLQEILRPSALRTNPRCRHFGVCGGCKWQHVSYEAQLGFKQQHVRESFEHIGGFSSVDIRPIIGATDRFFYRNKMEFSFSDQQWLPDPPQFTGDHSTIASPLYLGLHVPQRYDKVLDLQECHLQSEISTNILRFTREFARQSGLQVYSTKTEKGYFRFLVIRQARRTGEIMVNLVTSEDRSDFMETYAGELLAEIPAVTTVVNTINRKKAQIAFGEEEVVFHGKGVIHEILAGFTFVISAGSFFQTNTEQAEVLFKVARDFAAIRKSDTVFDLYSGTGAITIMVSGDAREVVGIESAESAIADAERNVKINGIGNCRFVAGDLKDRLTRDKDWMAQHGRPDVLIIDPPRSGMHPKVIDEILTLQVPRIVYVSCNPATQARDCRLLCAGGYQLRTLQPVDMFPHTYHVENVALMER